MKIKQTTNTKVGGRGNNLKLKARSLKRQVISRFQLLIIYINFMKKTTKKVGEEKYDHYGHYGHPTAIMMGIMIFAVAAVWAVMPANGAEAAFSCDFRI